MVQLERVCGWHDIVVDLLEQGQPLSMACGNANMPMQRIFNEMGLDPKFKARVERAQRIGRGETEDRSGAIGETARVGADNNRGTVVYGSGPSRR
jgi:hypothetical protein